MRFNLHSQGSPPLTREQQNSDRRREQQMGIAPAYAGTTRGRFPMGPQARDYPRSRGNNSGFSVMDGSLMGSPPLTREQLVKDRHSGQQDGITPAHAGTTPTKSKKRSFIRDHPRSRGNNSPALAELMSAPGSPPLTREQLNGFPLNIMYFGITPAHAGTTG